MSDQLPLFGDATDADAPAAATRAALARQHADAREIAARLPAGVFFGTSSWSFPGWAGLVYSETRSTTELSREGLREYARHPLLTTVGIDRSYYAPLPRADLAAYAAQLPPGFRCCLKAPAAVTALALGPGAGRAVRNPDFLSVDRLSQDLLEPLAAAFADHAGPIILEFPAAPRGMGLAAAEFADRLDAFLGRLPRAFEYAVELRDRSLLTARYRSVIAAHGVAHTYNYWSAMPPPGAQAALVDPVDLAFVVVRLLLRPGTWYEDQRDRFKPFDRLRAPDEAMRTDVVALARRALARARRVYVLVNNKAEGSSPMTVVALARRLAERDAGGGDHA